MKKITGIKSVDFKIIAKGNGVVNWNGTVPVKGGDGKDLNNHSMPKLRGYTNLTGEKSENGFNFKKEAGDINFKENPLYVSQNCIRHNLFKDNAYDLQVMPKDGLVKILASRVGLLRGYVVPASQCKRTSPLLMEDFIDQLGNGNFEQFANAGSKEKKENKNGKEVSNSIFSKTTFGDTEYIGYGSINIENLQFISLDNKFDRNALIINEGEGPKVAKDIENFISSLDTKVGTPKATFHKNYVRNGVIFEQGEQGILLNNDAVATLVAECLDMIQELMIMQCKAYLHVEEVMVDYNSSNRMMRIKSDESEIESNLEESFAVYYRGV